MKKFLVFIGVLFFCVATFAHTINWHVGDQIISTTTCSSGDNITPPTAPAKYGYHFKEWGLPPYVELEYIESTGTQYIDTRVIPNISKTYRIQTNVSFSSISANATWFMAINDVNNAGRFQPVGVLSNRFIGGYGSQWGYFSGTLSVNTDYPLDITIANGNQDFNGITQTYTTSGAWVSPLYLFAENYSGMNNPTKIQAKKIKIYENNTLIRYFIPAKRTSDNAIGMYDTVSKTFFTNAGAGEFIAGPEVGALQ